MRNLYQPNFSNTVCHLFQITTDAEFARPKLIPPSQQVATRAGRVDAEILELGRRERKECIPVGNFRSVDGELASDNGEEGLNVWDEGRGCRNWWLWDASVEAAFGRELRTE